MGQSERRCESHQDQFHRVARCVALLEAVKNKEKQKLGGVDSGDLQLFQSEEAKNDGSKALRPVRPSSC